MIAPELRAQVRTIVAICDGLAQGAMELRRDVIDDDDALGWVLRLQDRMAAVRIEAAGLLDDRPAGRQFDRTWPLPRRREGPYDHEHA